MRQLPYMGIRVVTAFRGMFKVRDELLSELYGWFDGQGVTAIGPFFLRLHVVDMEGPMDIEVGAITPAPLPDDTRGRASWWPW